MVSQRRLGLRAQDQQDVYMAMESMDTDLHQVLPPCSLALCRRPVHGRLSAVQPALLPVFQATGSADRTGAAPNPRRWLQIIRSKQDLSDEHAQYFMYQVHRTP